MQMGRGRSQGLLSCGCVSRGALLPCGRPLLLERPASDKISTKVSDDDEVDLFDTQSSDAVQPPQQEGRIKWPRGSRVQTGETAGGVLGTRRT